MRLPAVCHREYSTGREELRTQNASAGMSVLVIARSRPCNPARIAHRVPIAAQGVRDADNVAPRESVMSRPQVTMNDAIDISRRSQKAEPPAVNVVIEIPRGGFLKRGSTGQVDFISPLPCPFN